MISKILRCHGHTLSTKNCSPPVGGYSIIPESPLNA